MKNRIYLLTALVFLTLSVLAQTHTINNGSTARWYKIGSLSGDGANVSIKLTSTPKYGTIENSKGESWGKVVVGNADNEFGGWFTEIGGTGGSSTSTNALGWVRTGVKEIDVYLYAATFNRGTLHVFDGYGFTSNFSSTTTDPIMTEVAEQFNIVTGNVGIGTAHPSSPLHIESSGSLGGLFDVSKSYLTIGDGTVDMLLDGNEIYSNNNLNIGNSFGHEIRFRNVNATSTEELMVIKPDGKVGIGTNNPASLFHTYSGTTHNTLKIETDKVEGQSVLSLENDAQIWEIRTASDDYFKITDQTNGEHVVKIRKAAPSNTIFVQNTGDVGIGTSTPDEKLTVDGRVHAEEVKVSLSVPAPDYVFASDYNLRSLEEVANYIKKESHLPEIPSAKEMEENGIEVGVMNMLLLKKVEELTLYTLEQENEIEKLKEIKEPDVSGKVEELTLYTLAQQKEIERLKGQNEELSINNEELKIDNEQLSQEQKANSEQLKELLTRIENLEKTK